MATSPVEYERFPNAPIVEAILSVGVAPPHLALDESRIALFREAIQEEYPHRSEDYQVSGTVEVSDTDRSVTQSVEQRRIGYLFRAENGSVVRVGTDGFSFHHFAGYPSWAEFREMSRAAWDTYVAIFEPKRIGKIGLRYLNLIELPLPLSDLKEYLATYPEVAASIDTGFAGYLLRLVFPQPGIPAVGIITQAIEPVREDRGYVPLILDLDVARDGDFKFDEVLLWGTFERLRQYKNRLFFESITEKAKELFR